MYMINMLDCVKKFISCITKRITKENMEKEAIRVCLTVSTSLWIYYGFKRLNGVVDVFMLQRIIAVTATCYMFIVVCIPDIKPKGRLSLSLAILKRETPMFVFGYCLLSGVLIKPAYQNSVVTFSWLLLGTAIMLLMVITFCATVDGRSKIEGED